MRKKKRIILRIACMVLSFVFATAFPFSVFAVASGLTASSTITSGGYYYIRNKNSGHYLDAENSGNYNVIQYGYHGAYNQVWKIVKLSNNIYRIENQSPLYNGYLLRDFLSVSEYNDDVDLYYSSTTLTTQQWSFILNADGSFTIKSLWDNKVLQTINSSISSGVDVIKATNTGNNSQKWYLEKIPTPLTSRYSLESIFPDSYYWNHTPYTANNPLSIRTIACTHHGSCTKTNGSFDGNCGCNMYYSSIQCNGFARYLAKCVFGTDIPSWTSSTNSSDLYFVKPGDYIRYGEHSVFVVNVESDLLTIQVIECNYGSQNSKRCIIGWYREILITDIMSSFSSINKCPYAFIIY